MGLATLPRVIDLHCHLLPGIDDGPASVDESIAMARAAVAGGDHDDDVHLPPAPALPGGARGDPRGRARLQGRLDALQVPLRLEPGGEISLEWLPRMGDADLGMACLGRGDWLLVEMPFQGWPLRLAETLRDLEIRGFGVILAHPERAAAVQRAPDRMRDIMGRGPLVQVNAGSLTGEHGPEARRAAEALLRSGWAHFLASDAHSGGPWRPPGLGDGLDAAARVLRTEPDALRWMVEDGPCGRSWRGGRCGRRGSRRRERPGRSPSGARRAAITESRVRARPSASPTSDRHPNTCAAFDGSRQLRWSSPARWPANSISPSQPSASIRSITLPRTPVPMFTVSPAGPLSAARNARTTSPT